MEDDLPEELAGPAAAEQGGQKKEGERRKKKEKGRQEAERLSPKALPGMIGGCFTPPRPFTALDDDKEEVAAVEHFTPCCSLPKRHSSPLNCLFFGPSLPEITSNLFWLAFEIVRPIFQGYAVSKSK